MIEYTPAQVEAKLIEISNRIAKGVTECDKRYRAYQEAERAYDKAFASAYLASDGAPAHTRKYVAENAAGDQRAERDIADAAYKYSDKLLKALEIELRAWQSVGSSLREAYRIVGQ